ncbi:MAG TPA: PadR family transcriptional regulator [Candidatus Baltobacteraceae bacterium]|jgi:DNA-binding PadR family transcriptional regulator
MAKGEFLGDFEQLVGLAIVRLGDAAYAVAIREEIGARTDRSVSIGAVYATLERLERKGYVRSRLGEATPERGGRAKRFVSLTPSGLAALRGSQRALRGMLEGVGAQWQLG